MGGWLTRFPCGIIVVEILQNDWDATQTCQQEALQDSCASEVNRVHKRVTRASAGFDFA